MFSIKKAFYTNGVIRTGTLDGSFADDYTKRFRKQNHFNSLIFFIFFLFLQRSQLFFFFICLLLQLSHRKTLSSSVINGTHVNTHGLSETESFFSAEWRKAEEKSQRRGGGGKVFLLLLISSSLLLSSDTYFSFCSRCRVYCENEV